jgi:hypothetical protein
MACSPEVLKGVPLFSLLDADELAVLAAQVEIKTFQPRERIYKTNRRTITRPPSPSRKLRASKCRAMTLPPC